MDNRKVIYWYSVPDENGAPMGVPRLVTVDEFIRITHMNPFTGQLVN